MAREYAPLTGPKSLGDRLLEAGLITRTQLDAALDHQAAGNGRRTRLGLVLVELGFLTDRALTQILSVHLGIPLAPFSIAEVEQRALMSVPAAVAHRHRALPCRVVDGRLVLAVADAATSAAVRNLKDVSGCPVALYLASDVELGAALEKHYGAESSVIAGLRELVDGLERLADHRERLARLLDTADDDPSTLDEDAGLRTELEPLRRDIAAVTGACDEIWNGLRQARGGGPIRGE